MCKNPRDALKKAIKTYGSIRSLSIAAKMSRSTINRALSHKRSPSEDITTLQSARKIQNVTGLHWKYLCPFTYKLLTE